MKPGRELDALVAEKVMGYRRHHDDCNTYWVDSDGEEPTHSHDYSTDIAAAWEVVEKLAEKRIQISAAPLWGSEGRMIWEATWKKVNDTWNPVHANSAPHAICLAALKAVGHVRTD
jgi:hypothetical protein